MTNYSVLRIRTDPKYSNLADPDPEEKKLKIQVRSFVLAKKIVLLGLSSKPLVLEGLFLYEVLEIFFLSIFKGLR